MTNRDDFRARVVRTLALRAGHLCSNPRCRRSTSGPHSDPSKATITGEAAHICAAAPGGPRYDPHQTPEERRSIDNGIWLCCLCSQKIDVDWAAMPEDALRQWRQEHEQWVSGEGMVPSLPEITLRTLDGLELTHTLQQITPEVLCEVRQQELIIENKNRLEFHNLAMSMRLPESILTYGSITKHTATKIEAMPDRPPWQVQSVQAKGSVILAPPKPTPNHTFRASRVAAGEVIRVMFFTIAPPQMLIFDTRESEPKIADDPDSLPFPEQILSWFLQGSVQYELRGEYIPIDLLVPLRYRFSDRTTWSLPCQDEIEPWELSPIQIFPGIEIRG